MSGHTRNGWQAVRTGLLSALATIGVACTTQAPVAPPGTPEGRGADADDLLVVDCLLPGQIRQLGQRLTYLTPRRPIKTSASECEIRGGEYTSHDRANFATALKIWLPQAQSGDPKAQTYVGEIYEKGLGLSSDHRVAAEWYRRAAEQNYSRAQINLGFLYESGLGVEQDLTIAMNLYRAASGFDDGELEYVSSIEATRRVAQQEELVDLKAEVERLESANQALEQQANELASERSALSSLRAEVESQRAALLASATTETTSTDAAASAELRQTLAELQARNEQLEASDARRRTLEADLVKQKALTREARNRVAATNRELLEVGRELRASDDKIDSLTAQIRQLASQQASGDQSERDRLSRQQQELEAEIERERSASARLSQELESLKTRDSAASEEADQSLAAAEARERGLQQDLASEREAMQSLKSEVGAVEARYRSELAAMQAELDAARTAQGESEAATVALQQEIGDLSTTSGYLERLALNRQREIETLQSELESVQQAQSVAAEDAGRTDELDAQVAELESRLTTARSEQGRLSDELMQARLSSVSEQQAAALRLAELEQQLETKEQLIGKQQARLDTLQGEVTRARASLPEREIDRVNGVVAAGPTIEIIEPPVLVSRGEPSLAASAGSEELELIGRIDPAAELLTFKVNGEKQSINENGVFQYTLSTGDVSSLSLVAVNNNGERTDLAFNVLGRALSAATGTPSANDSGDEALASADERLDLSGVEFGGYHALIIGNNEYDGFHDLSSAENDAIAIEKVLGERYGFETELLLNATRYEILSALNRKRDTLTEKDNLLIYYAGHGELSNSKGYWLPVDAEPNSTSNWISNASITDLVESMSAKHVMVIADSCYSGSLTRGSLTRLKGGMSAEKKRKWYDLVSAQRVRTVLSSGGVKPVLDSSGDGRHSVFATALLDELDKADGVVETYELFVKVQGRVKNEARKLSVEQNPQYSPIKHAGHESGEFLLVASPRSTATLDESIGVEVPDAAQLEGGGSAGSEQHLASGEASGLFVPPTGQSNL